MLTTPNARHHGRRTAAVLTAAVALVVAGALAPAYAATPAVEAQAGAETGFDVDGGACTFAGSGISSSTPVLTVATKGTKSFSRSASGSASAVDMSDPEDSVEMTMSNTVKGSVTGVGGAFSKASATFAQTSKITMSQGLTTSCAPEITGLSTVIAELRVKKAGKITMTFVVPDDGFAQMGLETADGEGISVLSFLRKGTHTVTRQVKPGSYQIAAALQTITTFDDPFYLLDVSSVGSFKATYQKS